MAKIARLEALLLAVGNLGRLSVCDLVLKFPSEDQSKCFTSTSLWAVCIYMTVCVFSRVCMWVCLCLYLCVCIWLYGGHVLMCCHEGCMCAGVFSPETDV